MSADKNIYPAQSTYHEIAQAAIGTGDIDTISTLANSNTYLPIRWDAFIPDAPLPMVREFYHLLTPQAKSRADTMDDTISLDILVDDTTQDNWEDRLSMAIAGGRLDYVRYILYKYHPTDIRDYIYDLVPKNIILWLSRSSWLSLSPLEEAIITDDPSLIQDLQSEVPSIGTILEMVVYYDAINMYRRYGSLSIVPGIHGDIARYLIDKVQDTHTLDPISMGVDILEYGIQAHTDTRTRRYYLSRAMGSGYYELLDRYMTDKDLFPVAVSDHVSSVGLDNLPGIVTYLDHRYRQPLGSWLECYISRDRCDITTTQEGHSLPTAFWMTLLENAIIYGDIHTVSNILRVHTLTHDEVDRMYKLAQQYQITRPIIYGTLVMMIKQ